MEKENINLCDKYVGDIRGDFSIPSYQRGYRWGSAEVTALLDDIYESEGKSYCLQPVVVRRKEDGTYELIDGQQRLTTIYIVLSYLEKFLQDKFLHYELHYDVRGDSGRFLKNELEDESKANEGPDFYYMHKAYKTVEQWFKNKDKAR
ncbi:MAG: DUF262 domain-containing protein [Bacteroidales bacterium]|nr:DUF262 domain-containing protein [Bacteroidales bacterium]